MVLLMVSMVIVTRKVCKCNLCSHEWLARGSKLPICCAKCKNPRWNT